jgi:S1-C subfamily serine protease
MFLLTLLLAGRLTLPQLAGSGPAVVPLGRLDSSGQVEVCNGAPVSGAHVVTLYSFVNDASPFAITSDGRLLPDSVVLFRDLGLAMLIFPGTPFERWNELGMESPGSGDPVLVAGYRSTGITVIQTRAADVLEDGTVVLSVAPSAGLMGAPAYDHDGELAGIVTGTLPDAQGNPRLALLPAQLWGVWSGNIVNGLRSPSVPFGVSAMAYTMGDADDETPSGVLIIDVCSGSRAEACGLRQGDLVTDAGGMRVYHPESLRGIIQSGAEVELTVYRGGCTVNLTIR